MKKLALMLAVACMFGVTRIGRAETIIIDDFEEGAQSLSAFGGGTDTDSIATPSAIGGARDIVLNHDGATSGGVTVEVDLFDTNTVLYTETTGADGDFLLQWDGPDGNTNLTATGLGGADLTVGGLRSRFLMRGLDNDNKDMTFRWRAYTDASNWSELTFLTPASPAPNDIGVAYNDFIVGAGTGVDFASVGALELYGDLGSSTKRGFELDQIETPEPSGALLLMLGMICTVGYGWRRR